MTALVDAGLVAQEERNGRELAIFERDFDKIATLVAGNYLDPRVASRTSRIPAYEPGSRPPMAFGAGYQRDESIPRTRLVGSQPLRSVPRHGCHSRPPRSAASGLSRLS